MKTYQVIIVDDLGSHTERVRERDMMHAIETALYNTRSRNRYAIVSVTATTISTSA